MRAARSESASATPWRAAPGRSGSHDVTFAVERDGLLAVIRKPSFPPGAWRIPSGGIARGETFEEGARREALEETGLDIELTGYPLVARSVFTHRGEQLPWVTHVVTARAGDGDLAPRDREEIEDARWMTLGGADRAGRRAPARERRCAVRLPRRAPRPAGRAARHQPPFLSSFRSSGHSRVLTTSSAVAQPRRAFITPKRM